LITILLSTFNGGKYLTSQLDSIVGQTNQHWKLLIRDDGSKDETLTIIKSYVKNYPDKISIIDSDNKRLGACQSFNSLLQQADTQYTMFCDQDDIWLPDKIDLTLKKMIKMEKNEPALPVLIHTDLTLVDTEEKVIHPSFWSHIRLNPEANTFSYIAGTNNVTGNTMMINEALKQKTGNIPETALMHDWWIAMVASRFGSIGYIESSTILYRQHSSNEVGAVSPLKRLPEVFPRTLDIINQLKSFLKYYNLKANTLEIIFKKALLLINSHLFHR